MKKSLLATVAAVAFIAGTGVVAAESAKDHAGAAQSSHSQMNKGAEAKGHETTGSAAKDEMKSEPKADMKSGEKSKNKAESTPSKTTGSSANEMKSGANEKTGAEQKNKANNKAEMNKNNNKAEMNKNNKAEMNKNKSSTTGAGPADEKAGTNTKANKANEKNAGENKAGEKAGSSTTGANDVKSGTQSAQGSAGARGGSVNLTSEQKTKIRTTVLDSRSAPKVSRSSINFDIRVGTVVPRSVHFVTVPDTIVEIHPAWRGYSYFVVDEEIVIIDPHTLQIVAVLNV